MRAVLAILFLPIFALAQDGSVMPASNATSSLQRYLTLYSESDGTDVPHTEEFIEFVDKLHAKRASIGNDKIFLQYVFTKTHQKFLKHYTDYASFHTLLTKGRYNCLTGTAVYGLLLHAFGIDFSITETNYHIFLIAHTGEGDVLFEATDPAKGFVDNPSEIKERIAVYKQNSVRQSTPRKAYYHFTFDLYKSVSLDEVAGLLHYNLAIAAYNEHRYNAVIHHLDEAIALYQSPRIEELSRVVLLSVVESGLETSMKEHYVKALQSIRKKRYTSVARAGSL